ncbi:MAG: hypothetical protein ACYTBX_20920 [Planctomycetota bacterium]
MAKKRSKTTKTAAPKASPQAEPVEERSSFLPGEDEPKELESLEFKVEVDEDSELLESAAGIQPHTVAHDASVQYAKRLNEEAEWKERYAKRA